MKIRHISVETIKKFSARLRNATSPNFDKILRFKKSLQSNNLIEGLNLISTKLLMLRKTNFLMSPKVTNNIAEGAMSKTNETLR